MITNIRDYIQTAILSVDSDFAIIDDPFGDIDVSEREFDLGYKVIFGAVVTDNGANYITRTVPVDIEIYKKAYRDIVEDFDIVFEKALSIEDAIFDPVTIKNNFTSVLSGGVTPGSLDTNDRIVTMNINLSFRVDCSIE